MSGLTCPDCRESLKDPDYCPTCDALGNDAPRQEAPEFAAEMEDEEPKMPALALKTLADKTDWKAPGGEAGGVREAAAPDAAASQRLTEETEFFAELAQIRKDGLFAILFFGFRTAGKTWLLDRMKYELLNGDDGESINCEPPFQTVPEKGKKLPGSSKIEFHRVFARPKTFVLIDIPGEAAEDLVQGRFGDLRPLLAAMDYASAMIVALPSDIIFFGDHFPKSDADLVPPRARPRGGQAGAPRTRAKAKPSKKLLEWAEELRIDNLRIEQFATGLYGAVSLLSYLRAAKIDPADAKQFEKVKRADIVSHMSQDSRQPIGGREGLDCPTFFALTKADRVFGILNKNESDPLLRTLNNEFREREDGQVFQRVAAKAKLGDVADECMAHPWEIVRRLRRVLHKQLISAFPLGKFDYATAFYGHDGSTAISDQEESITITADHYRSHPQQGVYEILSWISEAQELGGRKRWRLAPYRLAARAQRYVAGYRRQRRLTMNRRDRA